MFRNIKHIGKLSQHNTILHNLAMIISQLPLFLNQYIHTYLHVLHPSNLKWKVLTLKLE